eukprot:m.31907 g.31907  ORF g.31907 m.31907 type:complete len:58 (+) comp6986_c0_seq1:3585-3758(+)
MHAEVLSQGMAEIAESYRFLRLVLVSPPLPLPPSPPLPLPPPVRVDRFLLLLLLSSA